LVFAGPPCGDRLCGLIRYPLNGTPRSPGSCPNPPRHSAAGSGLLRRYCIRLHAGITVQWQVADITRGFHATHSEVGHQPAPVPPRCLGRRARCSICPRGPGQTCSAARARTGCTALHHAGPAGERLRRYARGAAADRLSGSRGGWSARPRCEDISGSTGCSGAQSAISARALHDGAGAVRRDGDRPGACGQSLGPDHRLDG